MSDQNKTKKPKQKKVSAAATKANLGAGDEVGAGAGECEILRDQYLAGWQRTKADFENYKKQESERIKSALDFEKIGWLLKLISVYDNLEMAKEHRPKDIDSEWLKGVIQIEAQMFDLLKEEGIEIINPQGEQFNPDYHEAVEMIESDEESVPSGVITAVIQKGYLLNSRVLRPARVRVVK